MKKFLIVLCILGIHRISVSQTNTFPSSGNVGIGTTSPGGKLHIVDGLLLLEDNYAIRSNSSLGAHLISRSSGGKIALGSGETGDYTVFNSGGEEKVRITTAGNVGIGTTSPTNTLTLSRTAVGTSNDTGIDFSVINGDYAPVYARIALGANTATVNEGTGYLVFSTINSNTLAERMRITSSGNVGIGTTDPQGHKLAVNGSVIATSVKVELNGPWPDYVFNKNYSLKPLSELEKFIKANNRLPEIPSAKEVEKEGINLGEMDLKLLQKIEELTLYLIQKDKQVTDLQERVQKLEKQK